MQAGATYEEVHERGGGINHTVTHTRQASESKLLGLTLGRLDRMLKAGTTHVEIKSGYGLDTETEMKMLRVCGASGKHRRLTCAAVMMTTSMPTEPLLVMTASGRLLGKQSRFGARGQKGVACSPD